MTATSNSSSFIRMAAINVNEHVEQSKACRISRGPGRSTRCSAPTPPQLGNTATATAHRP